MFHEQNFKRVFPKQQNAKLLSSSTQPFICLFIDIFQFRANYRCLLTDMLYVCLCFIVLSLRSDSDCNKEDTYLLTYL